MAANEKHTTRAFGWIIISEVGRCVLRCCRGSLRVQGSKQVLHPEKIAWKKKVFVRTTWDGFYLENTHGRTPYWTLLYSLLKKSTQGRALCTSQDWCWTWEQRLRRGEGSGTARTIVTFGFHCQQLELTYCFLNVCFWGRGVGGGSESLSSHSHSLLLSTCIMPRHR